MLQPENQQENITEENKFQGEPLWDRVESVCFLGTGRRKQITCVTYLTLYVAVSFYFFFFWLLERNLPYFTSCKIDNSRSQSQWKTKEIAEIYQSDLFRQLSKCVLFTLYSGHTLLIFHIVISLFVSYSVKEAGKDYL